MVPSPAITGPVRELLGGRQAGAPSATPGAGRQLVLDLGLALPLVTHPRRVETLPDPLADPDALLDPTGLAEPPPDPRLWTGRLAAGVVEAMVGRRSPSQLMRWLDFDVYQELLRRCPRSRPRGMGAPLQVRAVRVCHVTPRIVESCAVVAGSRRSRAVALRLEAQPGQWRCTSLVVG
ncbi:MAG: hypothetical protein KGP10_01965 [Actinomycetales bacterium]|nr:hypothetical protein [Actinomycetales bacterium]